tara:strand:+ start:16599 stop:16931 length:333 start_codon:yes stop_codon:yes gene_type:complete
MVQGAGILYVLSSKDFSVIAHWMVICAGPDVAMESADAVLMKRYPYDVLSAIEFSRAVLLKTHEILAWATGYRVVTFSAVNAMLLKRTMLDVGRCFRLGLKTPQISRSGS